MINHGCLCADLLARGNPRRCAPCRQSWAVALRALAANLRDGGALHEAANRKTPRLESQRDSARAFARYLITSLEEAVKLGRTAITEARYHSGNAALWRMDERLVALLRLARAGDFDGILDVKEPT